MTQAIQQTETVALATASAPTVQPTAGTRSACDFVEQKAHAAFMPTPTFLGLTFEERRRVVTRDGHDGLEVSLLDRPQLWELLLQLPDDVRMLLPVHDSVLLETPQGRAEETERIVREVMETRAAGFTVPLKAKIKIGRTWAEYKPSSLTVARQTR